MSDRQYYLFGLKIAGEFGFIIAAPVVLLVLLGRYLDESLERGWLFTILGFILAALLSGIAIYQKAKRYGQEYQKLGDNNQKTGFPPSRE